LGGGPKVLPMLCLAVGVLAVKPKSAIVKLSGIGAAFIPARMLVEPGAENLKLPAAGVPHFPEDAYLILIEEILDIETLTLEGPACRSAPLQSLAALPSCAGGLGRRQ
jgi:hypothetical protein